MTRTRKDLATERSTEPEGSGETVARAPQALATLDDGLTAGKLTELQRSHGNAYVSRLAQKALLQRDGPKVLPPLKGGPDAPLSANEAVHLLADKLFTVDGLFDTMQKQLGYFEADMKTELGWYAGDKKASSKKKEGADAAMEAAASAAKSKAKETVTAGVKYLAGLIPKVGGPAGTAAGALGGVLWKEFDKIAEYDPVITEAAHKQPHQQYIEAVDKSRMETSRSLKVQVRRNQDEMSAGTVDEVMALIKHVDDAIAQVDARFYLDLVQGYRDIAPAKTVELETPHAKWSGEKRGLWGGGTYVTPIKVGTVYVEFKAAGARPDQIKIERTVVPELPRDVMKRFDSASSSLTLAHLIDTDELVMEGDVMNGWEVRLVKDTSSQLKWAESPSYSQQYLSGVASAMGYQGSEDHYKFHTGAVNVYAAIVSTPLSLAKLST